MGIRVEACERKTQHREFKHIILRTFRRGLFWCGVDWEVTYRCWTSDLAHLVGSLTYYQPHLRTVMLRLWVVLVLLSLCVKTQAAYLLGYATGSLPRCTDDDVVIGHYQGEMDGSGLANLSFVNGDGLANCDGDGLANCDRIIRLSEPGALSGINQKYRLPRDYSVQGVLYDHQYKQEYPARVDLISWETAGGDNLATIAADNLTAYNGQEVTLSFIPLCRVHRPGLSYAGPYFISEKVDSTHPITCIYRTTSLGRPIICFKGISTKVEIEKSLFPKSLVEIRSLSPPSMSSWYREYRSDDWWGTHSVRGVGVLQGDGTQADEKGFLVGTMHISEGHGPVILEGYVTIRTGGAIDPEGVFRLGTWESVQQHYRTSKTAMRTYPMSYMPNSNLVSKWTCITDNRNNYGFAQLDCEPWNSFENMWDVYPIGVWNQFSSLSAGFCKIPELGFNNTMIVSDYYQDSMVRITRRMEAGGEAVMDFEAYGSPPDKGFYFGPTKLLDCDRAVSHAEPNHLWQDMRIMDYHGTSYFKIGSVNTLVGMPDFQTTTVVKARSYLFQTYTDVVDIEEATLTQVFKSHNREVQSFERKEGEIETDLPFAERVVLNVFDQPSYTNINEFSRLHHHTTGLVGHQSFGSDPDGIICLLAPEDTCIVQRKPVCYVHIGGKPTKVNVQFPLDVLNEHDFTIVGNALYTGSVTLGYMDGRPFGAPSTVHGNIFPVLRDGTDGKPSASDGRCNNIPAVVITIMTIGMPLEQYARMVYQTSLKDDQKQGDIGPPKVVAFFHTLSVWFGYGKAAGSLKEVRDHTLETFAVFSTCNGLKGCLTRHEGSIDDPHRLALLQESLHHAQYDLLREDLTFLRPINNEKCNLLQRPDKPPSWVAQGLWAVHCTNGANIYFMRGLSFQRQVNMCLSRRNSSEVEIEASIYGLAFKMDEYYPMVVLPECSEWTADKISLKIGAPCRVVVHGTFPRENTRYYMLSPMFTDNHLYDARHVRNIDFS